MGKFELKNSKLSSFEKLSCQSWKLAYSVPRRCWFLLRHYYSQFPTLNPFLDKFGLKNSNFFILTENWHTWYVEDADSYSGNSFLIANPKSIFGQIWAEKVKAVCFAWKLAHTHMHTQYLEDVDSYFDISFLKFQT